MSDIYNKIEAIVESCGVSLYDIEVLKEGDYSIFRIYLKSSNGIDLSKCEEVSRLLSPLFDVEPPVSGEYFLEVSSPGIERKLKKIEHFEKSIGEDVNITSKSKDIVSGKILKVENSKIYIESEKEIKEIDFADIKVAKTYYQW